VIHLDHKFPFLNNLLAH